MERILQDYIGNIPEVHGRTVERLICVECLHDDGSKVPCVFLLKLYESNYWYRFFLDTGFCVWEKYEKLPEDDLQDTDDYPWYEFAEQEGLQQLQILDTCVSESDNGVSLEIDLSQGRKIIVRSVDFDGDTILEVY